MGGDGGSTGRSWPPSWAWASGNREDYKRFLTFVVGYLVTGIVPRGLDERLLKILLRTSVGVRPASVARVEERMRRYLPELSATVVRDQAEEYCRMAREDQWLRWRALHGPSLSVETEVEGMEHIQAAMDVGKGAVLWGLSFCETLLVKVGLHRADVDIVHLSTDRHGAPFPYTPFGLRYLVGMHAKAENHFLGERVLVPADGSLGYLRVLMRRLSENRCVYLTAEGSTARSPMIHEVFGRPVAFPTGAAGLAWKSEAPLLPVYVVREGLLRYRVVVEPPVELDRARGKGDFVNEATAWLAGALERLILAHPSSWSWVGYPTILSLLAADGRKVQY